jgi:cytochrome P450
MQLIGVPEEFHASFYQCAVSVKANLPYAFKQLPAWAQLKELIKEMIAQQRAELAPKNMLTHLIQAEHQGERLTDEDIRMAIFQLTSGGANTTSLLIGSMVYRLLEQRELWEHLQSDPKLVPHAIEESLRYDPPTPWVMRLCREETAIEGNVIPAGKRVIVSLASGNRNAALWSEPDTFSLNHSQSIRSHLGFGYGPHFCLGAPLARMLSKVALESLLTHLPQLHLPSNAHFEGVQAAMLHGPQRLEILWHPAL